MHFLVFLFAAVQHGMSVNSVNIWIHATQVRDQDVKMEVFVRLIIQHLCLDSDAGVRLVSQLHFAKFLNVTPVIQDHVKMADRAIWNLFKTTFALVLKDIPVSQASNYNSSTIFFCYWFSSKCGSIKITNSNSPFQANIAKSKICVHHHHATTVARAFHYLAVISNVIARKDSKERHAPMMSKNATQCLANMVEPVEIHLDLISK